MRRVSLVSLVLLALAAFRWWRKQVGFVGQEPILFDASVLENVFWMHFVHYFHVYSISAVAIQCSCRFVKVLYGLEEGETASAEHLENCKKMANLNFIDNHKAGIDTLDT